MFDIFKTKRGPPFGRKSASKVPTSSTTSSSSSTPAPNNNNVHIGKQEEHDPVFGIMSAPLPMLTTSNSNSSTSSINTNTTNASSLNNISRNNSRDSTNGQQHHGVILASKEEKDARRASFGPSSSTTPSSASAAILAHPRSSVIQQRPTPVVVTITTSTLPPATNIHTSNPTGNNNNNTTATFHLPPQQQQQQPQPQFPQYPQHQHLQQQLQQHHQQQQQQRTNNNANATQHPHPASTATNAAPPPAGSDASVSAVFLSTYSTFLSSTDALHKTGSGVVDGHTGTSSNNNNHNNNNNNHSNNMNNSMGTSSSPPLAPAAPALAVALGAVSKSSLDEQQAAKDSSSTTTIDGALYVPHVEEGSAQDISFFTSPTSSSTVPTTSAASSSAPPSSALSPTLTTSSLQPFTTAHSSQLPNPERIEFLNSHQQQQQQHFLPNSQQHQARTMSLTTDLASSSSVSSAHAPAPSLLQTQVQQPAQRPGMLPSIYNLLAPNSSQPPQPPVQSSSPLAPLSAATTTTTTITTTATTTTPIAPTTAPLNQASPSLLSTAASTNVEAVDIHGGLDGGAPGATTTTTTTTPAAFRQTEIHAYSSNHLNNNNINNNISSFNHASNQDIQTPTRSSFATTHVDQPAINTTTANNLASALFSPISTTSPAASDPFQFMYMPTVSAVVSTVVRPVGAADLASAEHATEASGVVPLEAEARTAGTGATGGTTLPSSPSTAPSTSASANPATTITSHDTRQYQTLSNATSHPSLSSLVAQDQQHQQRPRVISGGGSLIEFASRLGDASSSNGNGNLARVATVPSQPLGYRQHNNNSANLVNAQNNNASIARDNTNGSQRVMGRDEILQQQIEYQQKQQLNFKEELGEGEGTEELILEHQPRHLASFNSGAASSSANSSPKPISAAAAAIPAGTSPSSSPAIATAVAAMGTTGVNQSSPRPVHQQPTAPLAADQNNNSPVPVPWNTRPKTAGANEYQYYPTGQNNAPSGGTLLSPVARSFGAHLQQRTTPTATTTTPKGLSFSPSGASSSSGLPSAPGSGGSPGLSSPSKAATLDGIGNGYSPSFETFASRAGTMPPRPPSPTFIPSQHHLNNINNHNNINTGNNNYQPSQAQQDGIGAAPSSHGGGGGGGAMGAGGLQSPLVSRGATSMSLLGGGAANNPLLIIHDLKQSTEGTHIESGPGPLVLLAIGKTGQGKSSLLNKIMGTNELKASPSVRAVTKGIAERTGWGLFEDSRRVLVTLADTPGLADTEGDDEKNIPILKDYIKSVGTRLGISAFLLVFKIDAGVDMIITILKTFSDRLMKDYPFFWDNVVLVFTGCDYKRNVLHTKELYHTEIQAQLEQHFNVPSNVIVPMVFLTTTESVCGFALGDGKCDCKARSIFLNAGLKRLWYAVKSKKRLMMGDPEEEEDEEDEDDDEDENGGKGSSKGQRGSARSHARVNPGGGGGGGASMGHLVDRLAI